MRSNGWLALLTACCNVPYSLAAVGAKRLKSIHGTYRDINQWNRELDVLLNYVAVVPGRSGAAIYVDTH